MPPASIGAALPAAGCYPSLLCCPLYVFALMSAQPLVSLIAFKMALLCLQVFAPTFPGFGRSEKPAMTYSQDMWRDFLRDFIIEVVRRPVLIVGNSIGGFMAASLAGDYPDLAEGELRA